MSWRDWFSIESWFFTTAAAQGLRDARHDYPREDTYVETSALVQPVPNSTRTARDTAAGEKPATAVLKLAPYEFEELKIVPQEFRRELLQLVIGSHDPGLQERISPSGKVRGPLACVRPSSR